MRNHAYRFNITKLKSKGYTSAQEAIQNPGSNIEYTITVSEKWAQKFNSNGQYLVYMDRKEIKLLHGTIMDPVIMLKIELQADDAGNVNLDNVTTRKVRLLGKDKELVSRFFIQTFYSTDNEHLIPIDNGIVMDGIPSVPGAINSTGNECELPLDNKYWIYATVVYGATLMPREGFLEITIGNIVKYIPFSIIPETEAFPVDEDGPANCFITPVTYGVYSFDATVIGNGVDGIVAETRERDKVHGEFVEDMEQWHFKNAYGEDISVSKNVGITPKSAKLIWQDKENVISQVAFNTVTNRVEFLSHDAGNGVIAVYDNGDPNAEGAKVLWSWHIWCTAKPDIIELGLPTNGESYSGINYKIMDRDLGATTTIPDILTTRGLGYQWGRKDPLITGVSFESSENAPMYDIRGFKLNFKEIHKTKDIGTIEYAIKHPEEFIVTDMDTKNSAYDWLYYDGSNPAGNEYLWGNPYAGHDVVNIGKKMKTIYDPCPAGYKVPPQDIYGAFLKNPVLKYDKGDINNVYADVQITDFYPYSVTKYGLYFHFGEKGEHSMYFMSGSHRSGIVDYEVRLEPLFYTGHTSGSNVSARGNGRNTVMCLALSIEAPLTILYGFGGGEGWTDRVTAGSIRCVRDE